MFHIGAAPLQNLAVSPELVLRPSLSVVYNDAVEIAAPVSPGLGVCPSINIWIYI